MLAAKLLCLLALAGLVDIAHSQVQPPPCPPWVWTEAVTDPHLIVYGSGSYVHCAADGWRTYLLNKYFDLIAYASGFWIREVHLAFLTEMNKVTYYSGTGSLNNMLYEVGVGNTPISSSGQIQLIEHPSLPIVYIIDWNSWTLFVFHKPSFYYNMEVLSGHCVYRISCGLLIDGCPNDYFGSPFPGKKKRSLPGIPEAKEPSEKKCHKDCKKLSDVFYELCMIDCLATGKRKLGKDYAKLQEMQEQSNEFARKTFGPEETLRVGEEVMQSDAIEGKEVKQSDVIED